MIEPGATARVFDARAWKGKDCGDNKQFYKLAKVLSVEGSGTEQTATIKWLSTGRVSRGHFTDRMEEM